MAEDRIENLRLSLMQDVLPVGLAMIARVKEGGASNVAELFTSVSDPLQQLRDEGESAAKTLRERLDEVSPGLGNPVMQVNVDVDEKIANFENNGDKDSLIKALDRIESRLLALEELLDNDTYEFTSSIESDE